MDDKKKKEETKRAVTNLLKTDRGKAILFFLFYLVFFFIISIMARTNLANKKQSEVYSDKNTNISVNYDFTKLYANADMLV